MNIVNKLCDDIKKKIFIYYNGDGCYRYYIFSKYCKNLDINEYIKTMYYYLIFTEKWNENPPRPNMINYKFLYQKLYKLVNKDYKEKIIFSYDSNNIKSENMFKKVWDRVSDYQHPAYVDS